MEWYWIVAIVVGSLAILLVLSNIFYKQFFKRFYDIVLSGIALIVLSPLLLILTVVGAIAMGGNPFFVQPRPGKIDSKTGKERIFFLVKFRTMSNKKDSDGNLLPDSVRLNKYGKFLRRTSLDELPELASIFIGDMAIIGPRPLLVSYLPWYTDEERRRHTVRPGLTGWAQVNGRNSVEWTKRFQLDVYYVNHISLGMDLRIIIKTIAKVFLHSDIAENTRAVEGNLAEIRSEQQKNEQEILDTTEK